METITHAQQALVSIIVPAFNAEQHIEECLLSLVQQTWGNLEIIVVDDGSTDNTATIVEQLKNQYPIISLYKKENSGVSSARNLGLSIAKGVYIAMQDADDVSLPERIEKQVCYLEANNLALCGCGLSIFGGRKARDKLYPATDQELKGNFLTFGRTIAGPALLYKKQLAGSISFDESLSYGEDFDFVLRLTFLDGNKAGNIQECLYRYRKHGAQATEKLEYKNRDNLVCVFNNFFLGYYPGLKLEDVYCYFDICRFGSAKKSLSSLFYMHILKIFKKCDVNAVLQKKITLKVIKNNNRHDKDGGEEFYKLISQELSFFDRILNLFLRM
ncbi:glycosyltransferase family 2 protein [Parendozoicomonas haliclonae]|uniref:Putative glycosyltransferase EpsJ n=1 Tax=Parendozoicomonas haliclonae TaxID=1960125 RepID=A0A1X7ADY7_9GAMM|nr:glycosyltransferase family 2 protein [Parendozoicomonas haliclonae]SMA31379.1 putative glycosyltransferase EpsJ [Parendozoicomonas haliclonae]